jgi:hypothetical protein
MTMLPTAARITGSITRAQALDLLATLAAELANPSCTADYFPVCAEFGTDNDEDYAYVGIGNYGVTLTYGALTVPDVEAEAAAYEDARAARIESSYNGGR